MKLTAPFVDTTVLDKNGIEARTKGGKKKVDKGYAGTAKGVAQVLWERGLWKDGMKMSLNPNDPRHFEFSAKDVLANTADYRAEIGAMEDLIESRGHIVIFTPKGHPEIAGAGIEYDWGVSKQFFRRDNNHIAKTCEKTVRNSLDKISLQVAKHTARKARSYMRAYNDGAGSSHILIEKYVQLNKCHRNILDQDKAYLERIMVKIEQHEEDVRQEKALISAEFNDTNST